MKKLLLTGVAVLLLTTGAAQDAFTCAWPCNDEQPRNPPLRLPWLS
jgi:hypothetical protein